MTALAELRAGQAGEAFVALLTRTVQAVGTTGTSRHPAAAHGRGESGRCCGRIPGTRRDAQTTRLACGSLRRRPGARRVAAADCPQLSPGRGPSHELGRLIVRVRRALRESDQFAATANDRWGLADGPINPSEVGPEPLVAAAATIPLTFQAWSPTARRNEPFADRASIESLLAKVLEAAAGTLRPADLAPR